MWTLQLAAGLMAAVVIATTILALWPGRQRFERSMATKWREHGRDWASLGEGGRSRWCHANADYWEQPFWGKFLGIGRPPIHYRKEDW